MCFRYETARVNSMVNSESGDPSQCESVRFSQACSQVSRRGPRDHVATTPGRSPGLGRDPGHNRGHAFAVPGAPHTGFGP